MRRVILTGVAIAALAASMAMAQAASAQYRNDHGYPDYRDRDFPDRHDADRGLVWENSQNLDARRGWQRVTLWVGDPASALFIEVVRGNLEIDRAEIVFEGGRRSLVNISNDLRGRGRFPIASFNGMRYVDRVVVTVRPRASDARIAIWRDSNGPNDDWNDRNDRWDDHRRDRDDRGWRR